MAFETIKRYPRYGSTGRKFDGVTFGAYKVTSRRPPIGIIAISPPILQTMDWAPRDRIAIARGTGEHDGWIGLTRDDINGYTLFKSAPNSKALHLRCSRLYTGDKHGSELCEYRIEDDALYIRLPEWAVPKSDE